MSQRGDWEYTPGQIQILPQGTTFKRIEPDEREAIAYISRFDLLDFFAGRLRITGLPNDARVRAAAWNFERDSLALVVVSQSFDESFHREPGAPLKQVDLRLGVTAVFVDEAGQVERVCKCSIDLLMTSGCKCGASGSAVPYTEG